MDMIKNKQIIIETFPDKQLMTISERPWFSDMENYKAINIVPEKYTWQQRKHLYKEDSIMWHCHNSTYEGYHRERTPQLRYYIVGFGHQLYLMTVSCMFLHALNATKRVTSQNDMRCL